jgi:hypothetical protein
MAFEHGVVMRWTAEIAACLIWAQITVSADQGKACMPPERLLPINHL